MNNITKIQYNMNIYIIKIKNNKNIIYIILKLKVK